MSKASGKEPRKSFSGSADRDPDEAWIVLWQSGRERERCFRHLFETYSGAVYGFFRKRGFSPDRCEDLVQETFLGVHQGLEHFRREVPFRIWLFELAANVFRKSLRHGSAQKRTGEEIPLEGRPREGRLGGEMGPAEETSWARPAPVALRRLLGRERLRTVMTGLRDMPPQMRRCAVLGWYHGYNPREIAEQLGLSPQTVKVQLFRARQKLRRGVPPRSNGPEES